MNAKEVTKRNAAICRDRRKGAPITELRDRYQLTETHIGYILRDGGLTRPMNTPEAAARRTEIITLRHQGRTLAELAKQFGVTSSRIRRICKQYDTAEGATP